jgi:hypothetical protein
VAFAAGFLISDLEVVAAIGFSLLYYLGFGHDIAS